MKLAEQVTHFNALYRIFKTYFEHIIQSFDHDDIMFLQGMKTNKNIH